MVELQLLCKKRRLHAGNKDTNLDLRIALCVYEEMTRIHFQPEETENEYLNEDEPADGELDIGIEKALSLEVPDRCDQLLTEREPSIRTGSKVSTRNLPPGELGHGKAERKFRLQMPKLEIDEKNPERALAEK
ncbi:hypothetical protein NDU88_004224 [Pleurodeles waltl]|uniref:Uncharacterized protein n=1 Tax=Pleurodeles waltl TaxID=8319 RepID=A0AAV7LL18_PLEWA|nr:hypothetical protein NDU88_004224 [Pleurodeles waltl]